MQPWLTLPTAAEPAKANLELTLGGSCCSPSKSSARLTIPPAGVFFFLSLEAKLTVCSFGLVESTFTTFSSFTTFSCLFTSLPPPNDICPAVLVTITRKARSCKDQAMVVVVVAVGEVVLPGRVRQESVCGAGSPLAAGKPNHPGEAAASMGDLGAGTACFPLYCFPLHFFPLYCFPLYFFPLYRFPLYCFPPRDHRSPHILH